MSSTKEVEKKLPVGTVVSLGRPKLKGIAERFPVYALLSEPPQGLRQKLRVQRLKLSRRVGTAHLSWAMVGLVLIAGTIPHFSLEVHRQRAPIKDPATLERMLTALRKAGLK